MYAAQACDLSLLTLLMEEKSKVLELDTRQRSALHWSVSSEGPNSPRAQEACESLIAFLIQSGIQVCSLIRTYHSVLCCAVELSFSSAPSASAMLYVLCVLHAVHSIESTDVATSTSCFLYDLLVFAVGHLCMHATGSCHAGEFG